MMVKIVSFLELEQGHLKEIVNAIKEIPEVIKVVTVAGEYDLLVEFEVANEEQLFEIFTKKIDILPGLKDINSHYILAMWEK